VNDISSITARIIKEHSASPKFRNMMNLIDKHFDIWTKELFPILQSEDVPCYPEIVKIMAEAGYKVTAPQLRSYFSVIRERRGIPAKPYKGLQGVTPSVTLTSMAREIQSAPVSRLVPFTRAVAPVDQAVPIAPVLAVPGVEPVEVTNWRDEIIRLESEKSSAPWTGADQWMWNFFEAVARSMGRTLPKDFMSVEKAVGDPIKIDCLDKLLAKRM
jgi:hypothetical protein